MIKTVLYTVLSTFLAGSFIFAASHLIGDPDYCSCTLLARINPAGELELGCGGACTQGNCVLELFDLDYNSCGCPDQADADLCNCFGLRSSNPDTPLVYDCQTLAGQCNNNKTCFKRPVAKLEEFWQDACECR